MTELETRQRVLYRSLEILANNIHRAPGTFGRRMLEEAVVELVLEEFPAPGSGKSAPCGGRP